MPTLPEDVIGEIVDAVATFDESSERLRTLALVSKAFAVKAQAHLFRSVTLVQDKRFCTQLLDILAVNPLLSRCIKKAVISLTNKYSSIYDGSTSASNHWAHSTEGGKLMDQLANVTVLELHGAQLDQKETDGLFQFLRGRLQSVTILRLLRVSALNPSRLALLLIHFPLLQTLDMDSGCMIEVATQDDGLDPPIGWILAGTRSNHFRQLKIYAGTTEDDAIRFPPWFVNSAYLRNIERLEIEIQNSAQLFQSSWDLVRNTSSALVSLTMTPCLPCLSNRQWLKLNPLEIIFAPHLTCLELMNGQSRSIPTWMTDILIAIDPSAPLRELYLLDIRLCSLDPGAFDMSFWNRLDSIFSRGFTSLFKIEINVDFEVYTDENGPADSPKRRDVMRAMPNLDERGILELDVTTIFFASSWGDDDDASWGDDDDDEDDD
jgi:hypothetical protein